MTGCAGQTHPDPREADIIKQMPAIAIPNAPSAFSDSQPATRLLSHEKTVHLSIEQAVMAALQNNRDLTIQWLHAGATS